MDSSTDIIKLRLSVKYGSIKLTAMMGFLFMMAGCGEGGDDNQIPVANAGDDIAVSVGDQVFLNGGQSVDLDGRLLGYEWELIDKPDGSVAILADALTIAARFIVDKPGSYTARLQVFDGSAYSVTDSVVVSTRNSPPVAKASYSGGKTVMIPVLLDGSESIDEDGDLLTYQWELLLPPAGSASKIDDPTAINTQFLPDLEGEYKVQLVVSDDFNASEPVLLNIVTGSNQPPIAEAGLDRALFDNDGIPPVIVLNGEGSSDPNDNPLTYQWTLLKKPEDSLAKLVDPTAVKPQFTMDQPGAYVAKLVVNDGSSDSHPDTVIITTHPGGGPRYGPHCQDCHQGQLLGDGKRVGHMQTRDDCRHCHSTLLWRPAITITHVAPPDNCEICHNGASTTGATGLTSDHISINGTDCHWCHNSRSWVPAGTIPERPQFTHEGITGECTECHNGSTEVRAKSSLHMPASNRCSACHWTEAWSPAVHLEHTIVFNNCVLCHDENETKPKTHLPMDEQCQFCHSHAGWKAVFAVDHAHTIGSCVDCHDGTLAEGKSLIHKNTSDKCDDCHTTIRWNDRLILFDHNTLATQNCVSCHNGKRANAKKIEHLATTNTCSACHATTRWTPVITVDHRSVRGDCGDCHKGSVASGQPDNHIKTTNVCAACHATTKWLPAIFVDHSEVLGKCIDCHDGVISDGQFAGHPNTTDNCGACHTVSSFNQPKVDHNEVVGTCESCHAAPLDHVVLGVTKNCDNCHSAIKWSNTTKPLPG